MPAAVRPLVSERAKNTLDVVEKFLQTTSFWESRAASKSCKVEWGQGASITAEEALRWLLTRANAPHKEPFSKQLSEHGVILHWIAKARIDIDAARLIVLNAAAAIDSSDAEFALVEIAQAKILVPNMALEVIDKAVQTYGAQGTCQYTPLVAMWAHVRTVRIADGPDEAHLEQLGKRENRRAVEAAQLIQKQMDLTEALFKKWNAKESGPCPRL
ncbi:hypothetical protein E8E11_007633 [Didymella keratinophila]|nr:hypothetical protein E8E11_007633 [Didymella keratinophila]